MIWRSFVPILESELLNKSKVKGGRPPFDKLQMFKIIILQRYFNISDDRTEFQIKDRLSFMDFLNLELSDKIPDAKTIWFFKDQLCKKGLTEKLSLTWGPLHILHSCCGFPKKEREKNE